jgi:ribosomal protein S30
MSKRELKERKKQEERGQSSGKKGGRGTHGSLTKAGKVRSTTPKIEKTNLKKRKGPRMQTRHKFMRSLTHPRKSEEA